MAAAHRGMVRLLGADLRVGESTTTECPACGKEKKFSITRVDRGLLFNCYRGKCGFSGMVSDVIEHDLETIEKVEPKNRPWIKPLLQLDKKDCEFFADRFDIPYAVDWMRVTEDNRYAQKISAPHEHAARGWIIRNPTWEDCPRKSDWPGPKAVLYQNNVNESKLSWTGPASSPLHVVLVEDYISALKISSVMPRTPVATVGVALCGVHLDFAGVKEILAVNPLAVSIALDPDAQAAAYKMLQKWGLSFNACQVISLDQDPKDTPMEELWERLTLRW
jgi:hypothetical protein